MSKTHWKKLYNPDYLGAYALDEGKDMILTIKNVRSETITGSDGKKEDCIVCYFAEDIKPMILNATNNKQIEKLLKTAYIEEWVGHKIQIGSEKIKAFGEIVEALRVRKFLPQTASAKAILCVDCKKPIQSAHGMSSEQFAAYTTKKFGRCLCEQCGIKEKAKEVTAQNEPNNEKLDNIDQIDQEESNEADSPDEG